MARMPAETSDGGRNRFTAFHMSRFPNFRSARGRAGRFGEGACAQQSDTPRSRHLSPSAYYTRYTSFGDWTDRRSHHPRRSRGYGRPRAPASGVRAACRDCARCTAARPRACRTRGSGHATASHTWPRRPYTPVAGPSGAGGLGIGRYPVPVVDSHLAHRAEGGRWASGPLPSLGCHSPSERIRPRMPRSLHGTAI